VGVVWLKKDRNCLRFLCSAVLKGLRLQTATRSHDTKKMAQTILVPFIFLHISQLQQNTYSQALKNRRLKKLLCFQAFIRGRQLLPKDHVLTPARKIRDLFSYRSVAKSLTNRRQSCSGTSFDNRTQ